MRGTVAALGEHGEPVDAERVEISESQARCHSLRMGATLSSPQSAALPSRQVVGKAPCNPHVTPSLSDHCA
jgi:hypothetical protein